MSVQNTKSTESFIKHNQKLEDQLTAGGFTIVTKEEAVQILFDNGLIRPDRADAGNVIQNQFKYVSPTGDIVWIHTGIIGNSFSKKGSAWMMVLAKKKKGEKRRKVFVREFYRDSPISLIPKLITYGYLGKAIADMKPKDGELIKVVNRYEWQYSDGKSKPFQVSHCFSKMRTYGVSEDLLQIICNKENSRNSYLRRTQPLVDTQIMKRQEDIQKTWLVEEKKIK